VAGLRRSPLGAHATQSLFWSTRGRRREDRQPRAERHRPDSDCPATDGCFAVARTDPGDGRATYPYFRTGPPRRHRPAAAADAHRRAEPAEPPIAVAEADDSDSAPAPENQPETLALQAGPLSPSLADPALTTAHFSPVPGPDPPAAVANGPLPGPADYAASEAELMTLIHQVSGTPYVWGGNTAAGTDCSGLASWVSNAATGRPVFGDRFTTGNEEAALLERGFQYGTAPGALVIGWNDHHTAVTLADGTPVSSGEGGGVKVGGGGANQTQFTHHMFLPMAPEQAEGDSAPVDATTAVDAANIEVPAPALHPEPDGEGDDVAR
jgi:cell wall-associated NlpC family hydrolase